MKSRHKRQRRQARLVRQRARSTVFEAAADRMSASLDRIAEFAREIDALNWQRRLPDKFSEPDESRAWMDRRETKNETAGGLGGLEKTDLEDLCESVKNRPIVPSLPLDMVDRVLAEQGMVRVSTDEDPWIRWSSADRREYSVSAAAPDPAPRHLNRHESRTILARRG